MKFHAMILNTGYVEEATLSDVFVYTEVDDGFDDHISLMAALVRDLIEFDIEETERYGSEEQKAKPRVVSAYARAEVEQLVLGFIRGDMQTHGYFLFSRYWNTNCWGEVSPVLRVAKAVYMLTAAFFGDLTDHDTMCYLSAFELEGTALPANALKPPGTKT